jgi:PIN domain nuclease of toxin-antitoxin system
MKLLLDTHVAIWCWSAPKRLSSKARELLSNDSHSRYVSIVSAWEVAIKASMRKLPEFDGGVKAFLAEMKLNPVVLLPVRTRHVKMVETLPFIHRDPFDRLLVATAKVENMTILTADENIQKYEVASVW